MSDVTIREFPFHRSGHSCRRDRGAEPRNLLVGFCADHSMVEYHAAGEAYIRTRAVTEAFEDRSFINGFKPMDAARIGEAYARTRQVDVEARIGDLRRVVSRG